MNVCLFISQCVIQIQTISTCTKATLSKWRFDSKLYWNDLGSLPVYYGYSEIGYETLIHSICCNKANTRSMHR